MIRKAVIVGRATVIAGLLIVAVASLLAGGASYSGVLYSQYRWRDNAWSTIRVTGGFIMLDWFDSKDGFEVRPGPENKSTIVERPGTNQPTAHLSFAAMSKNKLPRLGHLVSFHSPSTVLRPDSGYRVYHASLVMHAGVVAPVCSIYPGIAFIRGPLRRYRRRRRGLCVTCGYDLTGNESGACPECGEEVERG